MAKAGSVIHISSEEKFRCEINAAKEAKKVVAVDFFATWCGPCRAVAPVFEQLSERYPAVLFLKVDVDALEGVAQQYEVNAMPSFLFLKDGEEMDRFVGANPVQLQAKLAHHAAAP